MSDYIIKRNEAINLILHDIGHRHLNEGPGGNPHSARRIEDLVQLEKYIKAVYAECYIHTKALEAREIV